MLHHELTYFFHVFIEHRFQLFKVRLKFIQISAWYPPLAEYIESDIIFETSIIFPFDSLWEIAALVVFCKLNHFKILVSPTILKGLHRRGKLSSTTIYSPQLN